MHSSTTTFFFIIVVWAAISTCYSQDDDTTCARNFSCGENFQNVGYPFWGDDRPHECGYRSFKLKCQNKEYPTIEFNNRIFRVKDINQARQTITIASSDLWENHCTQELHNVTFDNLLHNSPMNQNILKFYNCTSEISLFGNNFTCETGGTESHGFYVAESFYNEREHSELTTISCTRLKVPVFKIVRGSLPLQEGLREGFEVLYDVNYIVNCSRCEGSGGICGSNSSGFVCHCSDGTTEHMTCKKPAGSKLNVRRKLIIGFGASGFTLLVVGVIIFLHQRRHKKRYGTSPWTSRNIFSRPSSTTDLEQPGAFYGVHIFKYSELEKATGNFDSKKELGDGGFGTVYLVCHVID